MEEINNSKDQAEKGLGVSWENGNKEGDAQVCHERTTRDINQGIFNKEFDGHLNYVVEVGAEERKREAYCVPAQSYDVKHGENRPLVATLPESQAGFNYEDFDHDHDHEASRNPNEQLLTTAHMIRDGIRLDPDSWWEWLYDVHTHHAISKSWFFKLMEKESLALKKCVARKDLHGLHGLSRRLMAMFTYLQTYDERTKSLLLPRPEFLQAMICTGMYKEICPLPQTVKIDPAVDYLMALDKEAEIVPDNTITSLPIVEVWGDCENCQKLLKECPTPDVRLEETDVVPIMMPMEWSEPHEFRVRSLEKSLNFRGSP